MSVRPRLFSSAAVGAALTLGTALVTNWRFATRLMAHGREILVYRQPGFPQQPDWIDDMRLSGVVLGGKPYDPLPG